MTVAEAKARLDRLWHRGLEFLGCDYALLGGAMTWISEHGLVAAISNGGGVGVLACGSMTPDLLGKEIGRLAGLTKKLFGVNLIIMHPELDALADVCLEHKVSHVVLAGGMPKKKQRRQAEAKKRPKGRRPNPTGLTAHRCFSAIASLHASRAMATDDAMSELAARASSPRICLSSGRLVW